ncbi:MAG: multifunctional nuclease/2',3'-cyclic-nucleotide 2'-phosphodiesterase/5'-nucleotidase/3'-nucleotidase, partial [Myxococcales bacterium]
MKTPQPRTTVAAAALGLATTALAFVPLPAHAVSSDLVINEVYGGGGNSGANLNADFVELSNRGDAPVDLEGLSLQYRSATGTGAANGVAGLSGTVPAGQTFLVQTSGAGSNGSAIPTADLVVSGVNMAAANGVVWVARGTSAQTLPTGSLPASDAVLDLVGFGSANTFEGSATAPLSVTTSASRGSGDTDRNGTDFTVGAQTPQPCDCETDPTDPPDPETRTIAEIQGTGATSPVSGQVVTTRGVVTARYETGGFNGFVIQTPGAVPGAASHALFVYGSQATAAVAKGQYVEVTGEVSEYQGLTEISPESAADVRLLPETATVEPVAGQPTAAGSTVAVSGRRRTSAALSGLISVRPW